MQVSQVPPFFTLAFAKNAGTGYTHQVPQASQILVNPGAASLNDGFPPLTFVAVEAGGVPPLGQDFNGILNQTTAGLQWLQAGGLPTYNAAFSTAIGGYPKGCVLVRADNTGFWVSTVDNNLTNPDTAGAGWQNLVSGVTGISTSVIACTIGQYWSIDANGQLRNNAFSTFMANFYSAADTTSGTIVNFSGATGQNGANFSVVAGAIVIATPGIYNVEAMVSWYSTGNQSPRLFFGGTANTIIGPNSAANGFLNQNAGTNGAVYATGTIKAKVRTTLPNQTINVQSSLTLSAGFLIRQGAQLLIDQCG